MKPSVLLGVESSRRQNVDLTQFVDQVETLDRIWPGQEAAARAGM